MTVFAMLGAVMFCSKLIMEAFPNIHLLGMLTMVCTLVFRFKALIPIYIYVILQGLYAGFNLWWLPYLYIWTLLWAVTMLLPKRMPSAVAAFVYPLVCAVHGFAFGILYAPAQALFFHMDFQQTLAWVMIGIKFDIIHGISNFTVGFLILPLRQLFFKLLKAQGYPTKASLKESEK